jgi:NTP pyrophosphatase (non-canonical NTP hydrolase)
MDMREYSIAARQLAFYPCQGSNLSYTVLGLCGEAGEVANEVKKIDRDDGAVLSEERRERIADELGDVLWYVAAVARELRIELEDVAKNNLTKLKERRIQERRENHVKGRKR